MPRVAIKKKDYMITDLQGWITGRMRIKRIRQADLAAELHITPQALSARLKPADKGRAPKDLFSYGDLLTIFKVLEATEEEKIRLMSL